MFDLLHQDGSGLALRWRSGTQERTRYHHQQHRYCDTERDEEVLSDSCFQRLIGRTTSGPTLVGFDPISVHDLLRFAGSSIGSSLVPNEFMHSDIAHPRARRLL